VRAGNLLGIRSLPDLVRPDIQFMIREPGLGVRQWLEHHFRRLGIRPEIVPGCSKVLVSHKDEPGSLGFRHVARVRIKRSLSFSCQDHA
jgi:molybdate-binding protein